MQCRRYWIWSIIDPCVSHWPATPSQCSFFRTRHRWKPTTDIPHCWRRGQVVAITGTAVELVLSRHSIVRKEVKTIGTTLPSQPTNKEKKSSLNIYFLFLFASIYQPTKINHQLIGMDASSLQPLLHLASRCVLLAMRSFLLLTDRDGCFDFCFKILIRSNFFRWNG